MIRVALSSSALIGSTIETVLETAAGAGAQGVEWVDEGFIRPGDNTAATSAMFATLKSSLCTVSYAAAIRVGQDTHEACTMALSTAGSLNAPILRLLPADRGLSSYAAERAFIKEARMLGEEAGNKGITLCFGLSPASVLDSYHSAAGLIAEVGHPFVKIAWAPDRDAGFDCSMETLSSISGMVALVVVRSEDLSLPASAPVAAGRDGDRSEEWLQYLDAFDEQCGDPDMTRYVVLSSIRAGDETGLAGDIGAIRSWSDTLRRYHRRRIL